ncbi:hypothetical protein EBR96_00755, partial [bacterium]|nr:hypothetical protein [bacterium]
TSPRADFENSGTTYISKSISIGGRTAYPLYSVSVASLNAGAFAVSGSIFGWPTIDQPDGSKNIYWNTVWDPEAGISSNVGIGTTIPRYELDVVGTINVDSGGRSSMIIRNQMVLDQSLTADSHRMSDLSQGNPVTMRLDSGALVIDISPTQILNVSRVLVAGESANKGPISMWSTDPGATPFTVIAESPLTWLPRTSTQPGLISITANVANASRYQSGRFVSSQNMSILGGDATRMLDINTHLSHGGEVVDSASGNAAEISVGIDRWPALGGLDWRSGVTAVTPTFSYQLSGAKIGLKNSPILGQKTFFTVNGTAYGVYVDVSGVNLQEFGDRGFRYPAVFMHGGSTGVGIGVTPNADLEVAGTVIAKFFKISNGLIINTINVANNSLSVTNPLAVGVGTTTPSVEFDVRGALQTNYLGALKGITAPNLDVQQGGFVVKSSGVGVGTSAPQAFFDLVRKFDDPISESFKFFRVELVTSPDALGAPDVRRALTGTVVSINSVFQGNIRNYLGSATGAGSRAYGVKISGTGLELSGTGNMTGVSVKMSNSASTRRTAVFLGGYVGIGTTTPVYPLDVQGSIYATNVPKASFLNQIETASLNELETFSRTFIGGNTTIDRLRVGNISLKNILVGSFLNLQNNDLVVSGLAEIGSVTTNALRARDAVLAVVTASSGEISQLGIGTDSGGNALDITGQLKAANIAVSESLEVSGLLVSANRLFVGGGRTGIGTTEPDGLLHVIVDGKYPDISVKNPDLRASYSIVIQNPGALNRLSPVVGIRFVPEFRLQDGVGSAILAPLTSAGFEHASDLVFITDPDGVNDLPLERLRITSTGLVGIGTSTPGSALHVAGKAVFSGIMSVSTFNISTINSLGTIEVASGLQISTTANFTSGLQGRSVEMAGISPISANVKYGTLYADSNVGDLHYVTIRKGASVVADLSVTSSTLPNSLPYFDSTHRISGVPGVRWIPSNNFVASLQVSTSSVLTLDSGKTRFELIQSIGTQSFSDPITAHTGRFTFKDRTTAGSGKFSNMLIEFPAGTLGPNERAQGILVNLADTLKANSSKPDGSLVVGKKVGAVFISGAQTSTNVAIMVTNNTNASLVHDGELYVYNTDVKQAALRIAQKDAVTSGFFNPLVVSGNGTVGTNTNLTSALFTVTPRTGYPAMRINNSNGPIFALDVNGNLGIGVATASTALEVVGAVTANQIEATELVSGTLIINSGAGFVVSQDGKVGMGTLEPQAQFHQGKAFKTPADLTQSFVFQRNAIKTNTFTTGDNVQANLGGMALEFKSDSRSIFGDINGNNPIRAVGMKVDLSKMALGTNDIAQGIVVAAPAAPNNKYAAIFRGGNVGINVANPSVALDIQGTIKAGSVFVTPTNWTALSVTADKLVVTSDAVLPDLQAAALVVEIKDLFKVESSTGAKLPSPDAFTLYNGIELSAVVATFNRLVVPTLNTDMSLDSSVFVVSGSAKMTSLTVGTVNSGAFVLSGDMDILGAVTTNLVVSMNANVVVGSSYMVPVASPSGVLTGYTYLFSDSQNQNGLTFANPSNGVVANISSTLAGTPNRIAFFDTSRRLSGAIPLIVSTRSVTGADYSQAVVGTADLVAFGDGSSALGIESTILSTSNLTQHAVESVTYTIGPRTSPSTSSFNAYSIVLGTASSGGPATLRANEVAGGLRVNLDKSFQAKSINPLTGALVNGRGDSAVFLTGTQSSGNVIISDDGLELIRSSSDLYVKSRSEGQYGLWVQSTIGGGAVNSLVVSNNGIVSVGTLTPSGRLSVKAMDGLTLGLSVADAAGTTLLVVSGNSVGVGTTTNGMALNIQGGLSASAGLISTTLNVESLKVAAGNKGLVVASSGFVGIGTTTPGAQLDIKRAFNLPNAMDSRFELQKFDYGVADNTNMTRNLTVQEILVTSSRQSVLGDVAGVFAPVAIGMNLDFTGFALTRNAVLTGVSINVSGAGTRYPALFGGGFVGIGTSTPRSDLDVVGGMAANFGRVSNAAIDVQTVTVNVATLNTLVVAGILDVKKSGLAVEVTNNLQLREFSATLNIANSESRAIWDSNGMIAAFATSDRVAINSPNATVGSMGNNKVVLKGATSISGFAQGIGVNTTGILSDGAISVAVGSSAMLHLYGNTGVVVTGNLGGNLLALVQSSVSVPSDGSGGYLYVKPGSTTLSYDYSGSPAISMELTNGNGSGILHSVPTRVASYGSDRLLFNGGTLANSMSFKTSNLGAYPLTTLLVPTSGSQVGGLSQFVISQNIGVSSVSSVTANRVHLDFPKRTNAGSSRFYAYDVMMKGAIETGTTANGIRIDMRKLRSETSTELPLNEDVPVVGFKAAAVFLASNNGDATGNVGIFAIPSNSVDITVPSAQLHVANLHNGFILGPRVALFETNSTSNVLTVASRNGGVGIGTPTASATLAVSGNSGTVPMSILSRTGTSILEVGSFAGVGISTGNSINGLAIGGQTGTPTMLVQRATSPYAVFSINAAGFVGIGNINPQYVLDVFPGGTLPFGAEPFVIGASSPFLFEVSANGKVVLGDGATLGALSSKAPFYFGTGKIESNFNSSITGGKSGDVFGYSATNAKGIIALGDESAGDGYYSFAGLSNIPGAPGVPTGQIIYRKNSDSNRLVFEKDGVKIVQFGTKGVSIGGATPNAALEVVGNGTDPVMLVQTYAGVTTSLVVSRNGYVGIGTSNPVAAFAVSGNSYFYSALLAKSVSANNANVEVGAALTSALLSIGTTVTQNVDTFSGQTTSLVLGQDTNRNQIAHHIQFNAPGHPTSKLVGVSVNVGNVTLIDPVSGGGGNVGKRYSAIFNGGSVVIGAGVDINESIPLNVRAMGPSQNGLSSTGDVLVARSTQGGISGAVPTVVSFNILATVNANQEGFGALGIADDIFTSIKSVTSNASLTSQQSTLILSYLNSIVNRAPFYPKFIANPADSISVNLSGLDGGIYVPYQAAVSSILNDYRTKLPFKIGVSGTNPLAAGLHDYGLFLLTGHSGVSDKASITSYNSGIVAIGYSGVTGVTLDRVLNVSGDMRLGVKTDKIFPDGPGYGARMYFSGAPRVIETGDNDNGDTMFMGRFNVAGATLSTSGNSELRISVGEGNTASPNARFVVMAGSRSNSTTAVIAPFSVVATGYVDPDLRNKALKDNPFAKVAFTLEGAVGVGTTLPQAGLHVVGANGDATPTPGSHTALWTSSANSGPNGGVLAIRNVGNTTNSNYITFLHKNTVTEASTAFYEPVALGAIEGDGGGGVQFS